MGTMPLWNGKRDVLAMSDAGLGGLRRIRCSAENGAQALAGLRQLLSSQGQVISPKSHALTQRVFGQPLSVHQVVDRVCDDVLAYGLEKVLHYTEQFDGVRLCPQTVRVDPADLAKAHAQASPELLENLRKIRANVLEFQKLCLPVDPILERPDGSTLILRHTPIDRVGVHIPGGAAAYPSTLLMTVVPAQAAGVGEIVVVMPPTAGGANNPTMLAACHELAINEVYRVGGAQAIAGLAHGCLGKPVDMIVGPGNQFVALAKKRVYGTVKIDCLAGPSEVIVLADKTARPDWVAMEMLAQAEHSPGSAILVTWDESLWDDVCWELINQLKHIERGDLARACIEQFGAFVLARSADEAIDITNRFAPEHLQISSDDAAHLGARINNAGAIFLGHHTPVALGDYAAGPSHVLPTGGTGRHASGLAAIDFLKRTSIISYPQRALEKIAPLVVGLAQEEGLTAHARSVTLRLSPQSHQTKPSMP